MIDGWIDGQRVGWMEGSGMDERWMGGQIDGGMNERVHGWRGGWMIDGWNDGWVDRQMEG